ncbi:MAG: thioredoxin-disulfide reductase [Candidatus Bathyarchaeota archaeon]|nr:MAG: thioredoxin-disulfide reductase [Candidatus Bathyarchaeota archaeon]
MYDVIVLGAGPAGLTAAIYTSRARLKTLVMTGPMVGGQIALTYQIDNYPGFSGGTGPDLVGIMKKQAEEFGAEFLEHSATKVDLSERPFRVHAGGEEYTGRTMIIATGSLNRKLGLESEERLMGRGVFVCATCDALLYEGKKVVVIGGGDSAVQEALDLANFASEVFVVHRRGRLTACRCLVDRAKKNDRIKYVWNTEVQEILGESRVEGVRLRDKASGEEWTLECDGVLLAIGWDPNTSLFRGQLELDERGYIISENEVETGVEGVYVAGDLNDRRYRQVVTACSSGCKAALEAERYLAEHGDGGS